MSQSTLTWAAVHYTHNLLLLAAGFGIVTAFLFGLLGSVHCFGMCGPLVSLSVGSGTVVGTLQRQLLLYNLGRVIVYTDLGILLGGAGRLLGIYPLTSGIIGILAGGFVAVMGIHFLSARGAAPWIDRTLARPTQVLVSLWHKFAGLAQSPGVIMVGGLHGLLPCPLLYVMFSSAVAISESAPGGVITPQLRFRHGSHDVGDWYRSSLSNTR